MNESAYFPVPFWVIIIRAEGVGGEEEREIKIEIKIDIRSGVICLYEHISTSLKSG